MNNLKQQVLNDLKEYIIDKVIETQSITFLDDDELTYRLADNATPLYTTNIDEVWAKYRRELVRAFANSGLDGDSSQLDGQTSIQIWLHDHLKHWLQLNLKRLREDVAELIENDALNDLTQRMDNY